MSSSIRNQRLTEVIHDMAARFLAQEGNKSSLITVTKVVLSPDEKYATIFYTVFPESYEKTALEFAKRKRSDFKTFVKEHSKLGRIPFFDFEIDSGEKNRQKIDDLLNHA